MNLSADQRAIVNEAKRIQREQRKAATKARPKSPKADRGRETDAGFLAYLRRQPCDARHMGGCSGPIQAAHIRYSDIAKGSVNPGMGRKNHDRNCTALCEGHHIHGQHRTNERSWWESIGRNAYDTAAGHFANYQGQAKDQTP